MAALIPTKAFTVTWLWQDTAYNAINTYYLALYSNLPTTLVTILSL